MLITIYILSALLLLSLIILLWVIYSRRGRQPVPGDGQDKNELGEVRSQLDQVKQKHDELAGKNEQLFVEKTNLEASLNTANEKIGDLKESLSKYRLKEEQTDRQLKEEIDKLALAEKSLGDEKSRIRQADEAKKEREAEMRTKMWSEHESRVISTLSDSCQTKYPLTHYNKDNLPDVFDSKFRPDFVVEFSDEFVVLMPKHP